MEQRFFKPHKLSLIAFLLCVTHICALAQGDVTPEFLTQGGNNEWAILKWDSTDKTLIGDDSSSFVYKTQANEFTTVSPSRFFCIFNNDTTTDSKTSIESLESISLWNKEIGSFRDRNQNKSETLGLPRPFSYKGDYDHAECLLHEGDQIYTLVFKSKWSEPVPVSAILFYRENDEEKSVQFSADNTSHSIGENAVLTRIEIKKPMIVQGLRVEGLSLNNQPIPFPDGVQDSFSSWNELKIDLEGKTDHATPPFKFTIYSTRLDNDCKEHDVTDVFTANYQDPKQKGKNKKHEKDQKSVQPGTNNPPKEHDGLAISSVLFGMIIALGASLILLALLPLIKKVKEKETAETPPARKPVSENVPTTTDREKLRRLYNIITGEIGSPGKDQSVSAFVKDSINRLKERSKVADALEASSFEKPANGVSYQDFFDKAAERMDEYGQIVGEVLPEAFPDKPHDMSYRDYFNSKVKKDWIELRELKKAIVSLFGEPAEGTSYTDLLRQRIPQLQAIPDTIGKYFNIEGTTYDQLFKDLKDRTGLLHTVEGIVDTEFAGMDETDDCATRLQKGLRALNGKLLKAFEDKENELQKLRTNLEQEHQVEVSKLESRLAGTQTIVEDDYSYFAKKQRALLEDVRSAFSTCTRHIVVGSRFGNYASEQEAELIDFAKKYEDILKADKTKGIRPIICEASLLMKRHLLNRVSWINAICRLNAYSDNETLRHQMLADGLNIKALHKLYYSIVDLAAGCCLSMLPYPSLFVETGFDETFENDNMGLFISQLYTGYEDLVTGRAIVDIIRIGFISEDEEPVRTIVAYS